MRSRLVSLVFVSLICVGIAPSGEPSNPGYTTEISQSDADTTQKQQLLFGGDEIGGISQQAALTEQSQLSTLEHHTEVKDEASSPTLLPLVFSPLPLGSIKATPGTWLETELETSASGLAGNLHTFYKYIKDSPWIGGHSEYAPLNEGFPYWFNGIVALAYSLPSSRSDPSEEATPGTGALRVAVHKAAEGILSRQADDGWIGPESGNARLLWARFPLLLGLTNLADANESWVGPVEGAFVPLVSLMHSMLKDDYQGYKWHEGDAFSRFDTTWGRVRYADALISLAWLYERSSDASFAASYGAGIQAKIWECMELLRIGSLSWNDWYVEGSYAQGSGWDVPKKLRKARQGLFHYMHGVNVGQGLKAPAVDRRQTDNNSLVQTALNAVKWTYQHHGSASGTILADERVVGLDPWSGSELCTTVETLFSLTYLHQALGHAHFADLAEQAAYNALPASLTPDHWAHQYMTQANQPWSEDLRSDPFSTVGTRANVFGLEPQYPCCTVNAPQGWPKWVMAAFSRMGGVEGGGDGAEGPVAEGDGEGLVHAVLGPASVETELGTGVAGQVNKVKVVCTTDYPFGETLHYRIVSDYAFRFAVRVPSWYNDTASSIGYSHTSNDTSITLPLSPSPQTALHTLHLPAGTSSITYILGADIRTVPRAYDTVAIYRGALLYALEIGVKSTSSPPRDFRNPTQVDEDAPEQVRDYRMENTTPWNYAVDPGSLVWVPGRGGRADATRPAGSVFAPGRPELGSITARACRVGWSLLNGATPGAPPPVKGGKRKCLGPVEEVRLVPYGSALLHMAELPVMDQNPTAATGSTIGWIASAVLVLVVGGFVAWLVWAPPVSSSSSSSKS